MTLNRIINELKNVPVNRLEDLYSIIHSLRADTRKPSGNRNKILDFAGAFADMSQADYDDFTNEIKKTRTELFDRNIKL